MSINNINYFILYVLKIMSKNKIYIECISKKLFNKIREYLYDNTKEQEQKQIIENLIKMLVKEYY